MLTEQEIRNAAILECAAVIRAFHETPEASNRIGSEGNVWKAAVLACITVAKAFYEDGGRATSAEILAIQAAVFALLEDSAKRRTDLADDPPDNMDGRHADQQRGKKVQTDE